MLDLESADLLLPLSPPDLENNSAPLLRGKFGRSILSWWRKADLVIISLDFVDAHRGFAFAGIVGRCRIHPLRRLGRIDLDDAVPAGAYS